eukprot:7979502-Pyramimonas_sp.AAC.2
MMHPVLCLLYPCNRNPSAPSVLKINSAHTRPLVLSLSASHVPPARKRPPTLPSTAPTTSSTAPTT